MIAPDRFAKAMCAHWRSLGNEENDALRDAWWQMAYAFNLQIAGNKQKAWTVLPMPTGTGKTEGLSLYCSMMQRSKVNHPGVLIITRQIVDADNLRDKINKLANATIAVSFHSKTNKKFLKLTDATLFPVLIITHQAFGNALEAVSDGEMMKSNWDYYVGWSAGTRKLVVIDEALDITRSYHIGVKDLKETYGAAPNEIRKLYRDEFHLINDMRKKLSAYIEKSEKSGRLIEADLWEIDRQPDFKNLLQDISKKSVLLKMVEKSVGEDTQKILKDKFRRTVCGLDAMLSSWSVHSTYMKSHIFSTAYLILPSFVKSAVVLDATAKHNPVYDYLNNQVEFVDLMKGARSYRNVTLHVCYDHPVGKERITKQDDKHFAVLMDYLSEKIGSGKRVFFCVHKDVKDRIVAHKNLFDHFDIGHWGAIDGKNDWHDYDTMVIYGLPYLKPVDPKISVLAFQYWHNRAAGIEKQLELTKEVDRQASRHGRQMLIVNLIQAINRVRCRKAVDRDGNCEKTDVYLFLHHEITGKEIIEGIKEQMPGINVIRLDAVPTAKTKKDRSPYGKQIIEHLQSKPPGRYPVRKLQDKFGFSTTTLRRLLGKSKKSESPFAKELRKMNVTYHASWGRGAESCFVKGAKDKQV